MVAFKKGIIATCWAVLRCFERPVTTNSSKLPDLCPTDDAKYVDSYIDMLNETLINREQTVREIALTSPYSGGKSSLLNTYIRKTPFLKFTSISLASFKDLSQGVVVDSPDENTAIIAGANGSNINLEASHAREDLSKIENSKELLSKVTHCLITHCQKGHFDHLDRAGSKWLKENNIPVFCSLQDAKFISNKGINVSILDENVKNDFLNGSIDLIPCLHGKGLIGKLMAHGFGYYIQLKNEPSLYITGDTRLTSEISGFIMDKQPENIVLPAGGARFDLGDDIIMDIEEALKVAEISKGNIIANHLEALDHCPVTRSDLNKSVKIQNLEKRFFIPQDGESIIL